MKIRQLLLKLVHWTEYVRYCEIQFMYRGQSNKKICQPPGWLYLHMLAFLKKLCFSMNLGDQKFSRLDEAEYKTIDDSQVVQATDLA